MSSIILVPQNVGFFGVKKKSRLLFLYAAAAASLPNGED